MAGETIITVVGNITADPELRTIANGTSVASFTIASTPRTFNRNTNQFEDGPALFMRCSAWRDLAEHCANSLSKGMRVIAQGRLSQRSYQAQDGSNRTVVELTVDEIGPSLRYATAQVTRQNSTTGFAGNRGGYSGGASQNNAPMNAYQGGGSYAGGANYAQAQNTQASTPASDPWSTAAPSNDNFSSFDAAGDFGAVGDEPEF